MRFSHLKIGEHFFLDGLEYTKTSPLLAIDADGNSRIIPRSAVLQRHPLQPPSTTHIEASELDQLYQIVISIIRQEVQDVDLDVRLRQAIEQAWRNIKERSG